MERKISLRQTARGGGMRGGELAVGGAVFFGDVGLGEGLGLLWWRRGVVHRVEYWQLLTGDARGVPRCSNNLRFCSVGRPVACPATVTWVASTIYLLLPSF